MQESARLGEQAAWGPARSSGEKQNFSQWGPSSYKLKAIYMAQTEVLRVSRNGLCSLTKFLAEPQVLDTEPTHPPTSHQPCTGGPSLEFHLRTRIWLPIVGIWDTCDKAQMPAGPAVSLAWPLLLWLALK